MDRRPLPRALPVTDRDRQAAREDISGRLRAAPTDDDPCTVNDSLGQRLKGRILSLLAPHPKERTMLLRENWSAALIAEVVRTLRYTMAIDRDRLRRVFLMSYSRSGTHNFAARLHYQDPCFCIRENLMSRQTDPFQLTCDVRTLRAADIMAGSMFGVHGLQGKSGRDLRHVVLISNHLLRDSSPVDFTRLQPGDRVIFYLRNFLRVLHSMHHGALKALPVSPRKSKTKRRFLVSDQNIESLLRHHHARLLEYLDATERLPDSVRLCFHERFCVRPRSTLTRFLDFLGVAYGADPWRGPTEFFVRCFGTGEPPVVIDGRLRCVARNDAILGTGGPYNPLPEPAWEVTNTPRLEQWLDPAWRALAVSIFGTRLVEFWLEGGRQEYETMSEAALTDLYAGARNHGTARQRALSTDPVRSRSLPEPRPRG